MQKNVGARLMFSAAMVIFGTLGVFTRNIDVTSGELALYRAVLASTVPYWQRRLSARIFCCSIKAGWV